MMTEEDVALMMRAALEVVEEEEGERRFKAERTVVKAIGDFDEETGDIRRDYERLSRRIDGIEKRPRAVEFVQPEIKNTIEAPIDMTPVAQSIGEIGEHLTYAIKSLPEHKAADMGPVADAMREGFGEIAKAIAVQNDKIVEQNAMMFRLLEAIKDNKPSVEFKPKIEASSVDLSGLEAVVKKLVETMVRPVKEKNRMVVIDHGNGKKSKLKIVEE